MLALSIIPAECGGDSLEQGDGLAASLRKILKSKKAMAETLCRRERNVINAQVLQFIKQVKGPPTTNTRR